MSAQATTEVAPANVSTEDRKLALAARLIAAQAEATKANKLQKTTDSEKRELSGELIGTWKKTGTDEPEATPGLIAVGDEITLGDQTYVATERPNTSVLYQALVEHIVTRHWKGQPPKWYEDALAVYTNQSKSFTLKEKK